MLNSTFTYKIVLCLNIAQCNAGVVAVVVTMIIYCPQQSFWTVKLTESVGKFADARISFSLSLSIIGELEKPLWMKVHFSLVNLLNRNIMMLIMSICGHNSVLIRRWLCNLFWQFLIHSRISQTHFVIKLIPEYQNVIKVDNINPKQNGAISKVDQSWQINWHNFENGMIDKTDKIEYWWNRQNGQEQQVWQNRQNEQNGTFLTARAKQAVHKVWKLV